MDTRKAEKSHGSQPRHFCAITGSQPERFCKRSATTLWLLRSGDGRVWLRCNWEKVKIHGEKDTSFRFNILPLGPRIPMHQYRLNKILYSLKLIKQTILEFGY